MMQTVSPYLSSTLPQSRASPCQPPLRGGQEMVLRLSPYRPSSGRSAATFPQGKAYASPVLRMKFVRAGHAAAPTVPRR